MEGLDKIDLEKIIERYINDEASAEEVDVLEQAVRSGEHRELFEAYCLSDFVSSQSLVSFDSEKARDAFMERIDQEDSKSIRRIGVGKTIMRYAAVFFGGAFLIGIVAYLLDREVQIHPTEVTLVHEDGTINVLTSGNHQDVLDASELFLGAYDGVKLAYSNNMGGAAEPKELIYSELHVPYGKRFQVSLGDGTLVFLNSGSTLKYPVTFFEDRSREVYLSGQAYFEVSKNEKAPFIVKTQEISTKVYGTEFNVTAYEDDKDAHVVLVEGSVGVYTAQADNGNQKVVMLKPLQRALISKESKRIGITAVNVENYTTWKEGTLMFEDERFETIIKKLERHFNVSIENNNKDIADYKFTGVFDIESLPEILTAFSNHSPFQYKISAGQVTILP